MNISILLSILLLAGCASFDDKVREMREQAELCPGQVKFVVSSNDDKDVVRYMCNWDQEDEWTL